VTTTLINFFETIGKPQIVLATLLFFFVLERVFPAVRVRENLGRIAKNFSLAGLNFLIAPIIILPLTHVATGNAIMLRPTWWNMVFDLLILDAWIYGWHRINHTVPFLWRFHEVHHLDENMDASTALRFHFGEVALSALVRALVIWIISVPFTTVTIFETVLVAATLFHHSNIKLSNAFEKALSKIIVTPSLHWVHHHAKREDTDSNYATVLSMWDFVFKSRSRNERRIDMQMGVEGRKDQNIMRLILRPFWRA
jgi:sterol desaturase/sphingolipid hydroxylase (fatty acid hydroxylase superfamily)